MSYLSDAHAEWHYVNGRYAVCPLDCGAMSPEQAAAEAEWEAEQEAEAARTGFYAWGEPYVAPTPYVPAVVEGDPWSNTADPATWANAPF